MVVLFVADVNVLWRVYSISLHQWRHLVALLVGGLGSPSSVLSLTHRIKMAELTLLRVELV